MSFGYFCEASGLQYAGTDLNAMFAQQQAGAWLGPVHGPVEPGDIGPAILAS